MRRLLDILRKKRMALALIDHPWMTPIAQLVGKFDVVTADFAYIRWLGDRKGIEEKTKNWDKSSSTGKMKCASGFRLSASFSSGASK